MYTVLERKWAVLGNAVRRSERTSCSTYSIVVSLRSDKKVLCVLFKDKLFLSFPIKKCNNFTSNINYWFKTVPTFTPIFRFFRRLPELVLEDVVLF